MSKVKTPRHVQGVIDYIKSLGLEPITRLGKHYVISWQHGTHHGRVVVPSTPRDETGSLHQCMHKVQRQVQGRRI